MSLNYECDSCKRPISQEELESKQALVFQGQHYCSRCKIPVIAFLKKNMASKTGSREGSPEATRSPKTSGPGTKSSGGGVKKSGTKTSGPGTKSSGGPGKKPGTKKSGPPVARSPAAGLKKKIRTSESKRPLGKVPPRAKAAPRRGPGAARSRVKKEVAGPPPSLSADDLPQDVASSAGESPFRSKIRSRRAGTRRPLSRLRRGHKEEEGETPEPGRRRTALFAVGILVLIALGVTAFFVFGSGERSSQVPEVVSTPSRGTAETEQPSVVEERERERAKKLSERAVKEQNTRALRVLLDEISRGVFGSSSAEVRDQLQRLKSQVESRYRGKLEALFEKTKLDSETLKKKDQYQVALAKWQNEPLVIQEDSEFHQKWSQERVQVSRKADKYKYWGTIQKKVASYVDLGHPEIALAVIKENIGEQYRSNFPEIYDKSRDLLKTVQKADSASKAELIRRQRAIREAEEEARRIALAKKRQELWENALNLIPWVPLISKSGDLENWVQGRVQPPGAESLLDLYYAWLIESEDGKSVLTSDNRDHSEPVAVGYNGNRWQDWALSFEILVPRKKVSLELRSVIRGGGVDRIFQKAEKDIKFGKSFRADWVPVYIEVVGQEIRYFKGATEEMVVSEKLTPTRRIHCEHETGGFVFRLDKGGECKIRNVELKLVFDLEEDEEEGEEDDDEIIR